MAPSRTEAQIRSDFERVALDLAQIGNFLEGSLQNSVKRYRKKDGTISEYTLPPVLQYPLEGGGQSRMRIPAQHVPLVRRLLDAGKRRRELLARHRALSLEWTKVQLRDTTPEKKTTRRSRSSR